MTTQCTGQNCGTTTGNHSPECLAEHAAAVAGGRFVKLLRGDAEARDEQLRKLFFRAPFVQVDEWLVEARAALASAPAVDAGARDEREAFEAWAATEYGDDGDDSGFSLKRQESGYLYSGIDDAWQGWQARAALSAKGES